MYLHMLFTFFVSLLQELVLLSKELPNTPSDGAGSDLITFDTQKHIENIVNAIGFHLWTTVF